MKLLAGAIGVVLLAVTAARPVIVPSQPARFTLELEDYAALPITADNTDANTRAQLARVNYLRDEPGGRRFFVNDLNGPLYILDKQTKTFTKYLDFNGLPGQSGLFPKFTYARNFATGLTNVILDPDYARNGVFYTLHTEDPSLPGAAAPRSAVAPGLDISGYTTTASVRTPTVNGKIDRECVLVEWTDRNIANTTFEGTARELLRVQYPLAPHPLGEMTFNPSARQGDPDWRVMYLGAGDSQSGEQRDSRRSNPQRLDTLVGKILRILPDLREHTATSMVSENGRYRVPNDNPFVAVGGARKEIWAYGLRNPHRLAWDGSTLLAFNIGLVTWEAVDVIHKGANYGYPLREGTQSMSETNGMGPLPERDEIAVQVSDTTTHGTVKPTYPVIAYPHTRDAGGDAIAGGFVYRGTLVAALKDKLIFGDITVGRILYADRTDLLAADDGNASTLAAIHEMETGLRQLTEETYRRRGGRGDALPGVGAQSGRGRVDLRFGIDNDGELYILTKSDGMIRKVVGVRTVTTSAVAAAAPAPSPVSIAVGKRPYDATCAPCHGDRGQGAVKAGLTMSIIEEQHGKQPPDLTDDQWDHGSSDADIFNVIKRGVPSTMMAGFGGALSDDEIRSIVSYVRSLAPKK